VLVGRDRELSLLEDALLAANRGEGQLVILAGEAGIGKTRLATQLQKRALKGGTIVLWGGCSEADLSLPYLPFVEAIGNYLRRVDLDDLRARLGPAQRELGHLFPQFTSDRPSNDGESGQAKLRLFEAILALVRVPADQHGLLLVIEDIHWADAATRDLIDYLARRLQSSRTLILLTYRSDEMHRKHPLLPMIQGWGRSNTGAIVKLEALASTGVAEMVQAIFDAKQVGDEFTSFLHGRSEGNPFVLEELLKAALDRGDVFRRESGWDRKAIAEWKLPQTVRETILLRIERMSPEQVEILRTAAVLGPSFAYMTLAAVSGRDKESVQQALQVLVQRQLIEDDSQGRGRYRFRHALTREAIYEDMIAPRRAELHAQAAEQLREMPDTNPVDLAYHLLAAGQWDEAVPVCLEAAADAERRMGFREATELYERALPHVSDPLLRAQVLCRLGHAYWSVGDAGRAAPLLESGIAKLEEGGRAIAAAGYRIWLGRCYWENSQPDLASREYERARSCLEPLGPSEDLATAYVRLASMSGFNCEYGNAVTMAKQAIAIAEAANADSARIFAYNYLGCSLAEIGDLDEALGYLDRSYREAAARGLDWMASSALRNAFSTRFNHWRGLEAAALIPELRRVSKTSSRDEALIDAIEATVALYVEGNPEAAKQHFEHSIRLDQGALEASENNRELSLVYAALEDFEQAQRLLPPMPTNGDRQQIVMHRYSAIRLAFDAGDLRTASQLARLALDLLRGRSPIGLLELWLADKAVEAFLTAGDVSAATALTALTRLAWKDPDDPLAQRMEGRLAFAKGDFERARTRLSQAADFLNRCGHRDEEWRTRRALAAAKAALKDLPGAEAELRGVLEVASATGHLFEANASRKQLRELGVEVPEPLSAHERDEATLRKPQERLLTVLFVDVRGYTAMTQRQAPEDMVDRLQAFLRWSENEISKHHGMVDQYAGDSLMATFNVSAMRLDHTILALQAALAIRDKAAYAGLPVGVGIATGAAVVGELGGKLTAVGDTINLASRLQTQAGAGEILLSADAYRRVGDWLKSSEQVPTETSLSLKGFDGPVVAYRLQTRAPVKPAP